MKFQQRFENEQAWSDFEAETHEAALEKVKATSREQKRNVLLAAVDDKGQRGRYHLAILGSAAETDARTAEVPLSPLEQQRAVARSALRAAFAGSMGISLTPPRR